MSKTEANIIKHAIVKKKVNLEAFNKHKAVLVECIKNGSDLPYRTARYFGNKKPSMELLNKKLFTTYEPTIVADGYSIGYVFDFSKMPKGAENMTIVFGI
jgi:hypothetical protein